MNTLGDRQAVKNVTIRAADLAVGDVYVKVNGAGLRFYWEVTEVSPYVSNGRDYVKVIFANVNGVARLQAIEPVTIQVLS